MYKLIRYCKKHSVSENEAIKAIHNYFYQQGYTKTNWKNERFGFYADLRIKNSGASTISLVKKLVLMEAMGLWVPEEGESSITERLKMNHQ